MKHRLLASLGSAILLAACATGPGSGWGEITGEISTGFEPPAERLTDDGRLKTDNSYRIRIDTLEVELGDVQLLASEGAVAAADDVEFDPADPPPGYSNCHAGHCHAEDGSLPTYEEIRQRLSGADSVTERTLVTLPTPELKIGSRQVVSVDESHCEPSCLIDDMVTIDTAALPVGHLHLTGVVESIVDSENFPEAVGFEVEVHIDTSLRETLALSFDPDSLPVAELGGHFSLTPRLLDGIDWPTAMTGATLSEEALEQIRENFLESEWHVDVRWKEAIEE